MIKTFFKRASKRSYIFGMAAAAFHILLVWPVAIGYYFLKNADGGLLLFGLTYVLDWPISAPILKLTNYNDSIFFITPIISGIIGPLIFFMIPISISSIKAHFKKA